MSDLTTELLLVEDDPADAELILYVLNEEGISGIRHVSDGEEAVDLLLRRGAFADRAPGPLPRVVLLDIKLPRVDGLAVLGMLKGDVRTANVPVVMLTSSGLDRDIARAYRLGANSFVQKPVTYEAFRDTVRRVARYWLATNERPPKPPESPL
jgi:CheY-like chemotaxis protein